jgi:hypothetical protein
MSNMIDLRYTRGATRLDASSATRRSIQKGGFGITVSDFQKRGFGITASHLLNSSGV